MALPKHKISRAKGRMRRANAFRLSVPNVPDLDVPRGQANRSDKFFCPSCNQPKAAHVTCPNCGYYRGRSLEIER